MNKNNDFFGVLAAGLALFSMFFGAGDLIWPLILGGMSGDKNLYAMLGLLITGVSLPLLGLISMMLFKGKYREFFAQAGKWPGIILIIIIQSILGPLGSIPRLITLSYATLKPYFPLEISLLNFSILSSILVLILSFRKSKVISLVGLVLTPILLGCLGLILILGFMNPPAAFTVDLVAKDVFSNGLSVGYNTLDLIAAFIFAPMVMSHFIVDEKEMDTAEGKKQVFGKMLKASLIAAGLLSIMFIGLTYLASYYTPFLPPHLPEERLSLIAMHILGPYGAFFACLSIAMACLTTAIPILSVCAEYLQDDWLPKNKSPILSQVIVMGLSIAVANLGFMGIAEMLSPLLALICPSLIVLSISNILHKMYEVRARKTPVAITFALSAINHFV